MRAVAFNEFGVPPAVREVEVPRPGEAEVRVRVRAASVNGFDLAVANGMMKGMMEHRFPVVLGKDFAGTVDAVGTGVTGYSSGDRVFGVVTKPYVGDGSFAEFVTVPVAVGLAKLPESVGFTEGGALGLAGVAALAAVDAAGAKAGTTILVSGATGGVGNQAVQLAAKAGTHVIATAGTDEERHLVRSLGAAEVADYTMNIADQVLSLHPDGVEAVLHLAGNPADLLAAVRRGGLFVSTLVGSPQQLPTDTATVVAIYANPTQATLERLAANQAQGATRVTIQGTYGLDDGPRALEDFRKGTRGKLVIVND